MFPEFLKIKNFWVANENVILIIDIIIDINVMWKYFSRKGYIINPEM